MGKVLREGVVVEGGKSEGGNGSSFFTDLDTNLGTIPRSQHPVKHHSELPPTLTQMPGPPQSASKCETFIQHTLNLALRAPGACHLPPIPIHTAPQTLDENNKREK